MHDFVAHGTTELVCNSLAYAIAGKNRHNWSRGAMGGYRTVASRAGDAIDQSDEPATLGGPARLVIGAAVFLLGMLVGTALAAWVVPPV
jgi:hypothetical protein